MMHFIFLPLFSFRNSGVDWSSAPEFPIPANRRWQFGTSVWVVIAMRAETARPGAPVGISCLAGGTDLAGE